MEKICRKTWNTHFPPRRKVIIGELKLCIHKQFPNESFNSGSLWATMCAPLCIAIMAYTAHLNSKWQVLIGLQKWTFYHSISPQRNIFADRRLYESIKLSTEVRLLNEILAGNPCFCFQNCPNFDPKYTNWIIKARIFCFFSSCSFALK